MNRINHRCRDFVKSLSVLLRGFHFAALAFAFTIFMCPGLRAGDNIEPGNIKTCPTWNCVGINWYFKGDENRNASVTTEFRRKNTLNWRAALPLWLHDYDQTTMFSGSVFRLAPDTEYEFKLKMDDIDGGGSVRAVTAKTLSYPTMPSRVVAVNEGGLAEAQRLARPGTVMLLSKGTYPATALTKSGRPGQWIVYKGAGKGEQFGLEPTAEGVVIEGQVRIQADYIWLHGLTVRSTKTAIQGSHTGVCITNCHLLAHYAIHTPRGAQNYFIADNLLEGDAEGKFSFSGEGVDFGSDKGQCGHAVCFNEITDFADGISYGRGNIDVYNNYIHETVDDFIEPDYSRENYRIWNNRCYNSMCGFSFQPMKGGPWYIFYNINVGAYLHPFKVKTISGPSIIYGNTILTKSSMLGQGGDLLRGSILNNVWLRITPGPLANGGTFRPGSSPTCVDYNAYGTGGHEPFARIRYKELAERHKWDEHSLTVGYKEVFQGPVKIPIGEPYYSSKLQGKVLPEDWRFEHHLLLPKEDSRLIDAGTTLPNLTAPYLGEAPDLGAHELGLGTAWYGPRMWDEDLGLAYGVPEGWKKVEILKPAEYKLLRYRDASGKEVLLACENPRIVALIQFESSQSETRWKRQREILEKAEGATSKVIEFQDGFGARLCRRDDNVVLVASRVEMQGVLHVTAGCKADDWPKAQLDMFRFIRSFFR